MATQGVMWIRLVALLHIVHDVKLHFVPSWLVLELLGGAIFAFQMVTRVVSGVSIEVCWFLFWARTIFRNSGSTNAAA